MMAIQMVLKSVLGLILGILAGAIAGALLAYMLAGATVVIGGMILGATAGCPLGALAGFAGSLNTETRSARRRTSSGYVTVQPVPVRVTTSGDA